MGRFLLGFLTCFAVTIMMLSGCQHGEEVGSGNSIPLTDKENILYKQAMVRCHKTGGTRIVKISGQLRCF